MCIISSLVGVGPVYYTQLVPDFGGKSLDTDPNFSQYWHFCGTIIDVTSDRNPYKGVTRIISDK